ncbi:MAG: WD40/YVTN/BNR-like repeat-containing protein [Terriglobales bacterium]
MARGVKTALVTLLGLGAGLLAQTPVAARAMRWRSIGPAVGGRVVAIAGVAGARGLYYMGTVGGGVWKTTDGGLAWQNISDRTLGGSSASIGALAVAPSNPSILYAGTGEADIRNDMILGDGIYRSDDAGAHWRYAGLRENATTSAIVVDPNNPDVVYAGSMGDVFVPDTNRGVFKSTDGGAHWSRVLFVDDHTGCIGISMAPSQPDVLYAAMWQAQRFPWALSSGGPGSGLYKSTDGGVHWSNLSHNPGMPAGVLGRMGVSVSPANPSVVYAMIQAKQGGVFRSEDAGATWTRVNRDQALRQRAFYYMSIYADPKDPNTAYTPEVDALWVTHDGGKTFAQLHTPHGDNHIVWINPDDTQNLEEGNDGGATVSTDGGRTWTDERNQPTGEFYHVNLDDQFPFHVYGAQQDEGSTEGPSAAPGSIALADWQRVAYGESTWSVPQPGDPNITYGSGYFSIFMRYNLALGEYQDISPWPNYLEGASAGELKYRMGWTHPILFSPTDPKELLVGAQSVVRSDDYGQTWREISPDLTRNQPATEAPSGGPIDLDQSGAEIYPGISALAVSPRDGDVIWAGSDDGLVHVTTDGGGHWTAVNPPALPAESWISSFQPSYADRSTAYLTSLRYKWGDNQPYVYKTTDMGKTWQAITAGLPADSYAFAIRQDPNEPDLMFLCTNSTVYVSFDAGGRWQPLKLNLPTVQVRDLAVNTQQGEVVIATHGRAFWILDNLALLEQLTKAPEAAADAATLYAPETAWLTHAYGAGGYGGSGATGQNPPLGVTVFFHLPASYNSSMPVTMIFSDSSGHVIRTFHFHRRPAAAPVPQSPQPAARAAQTAPAQRQAEAMAISPGTGGFVWNLQYPDATEVTGFRPPDAAGGLEDTVAGPVVTPGSYTVTLDYGGQKMEQQFEVALDPRIHASQSDLDARLALALQIHDDLNGLDQKLNQAIALRDRLTKGGQTDAALRNLEDTIANLVQLKITASEGSLLYETKLRSHLAYLATDIALDYARPTAAQYAVFKQLNAATKTGLQQLEAAIAAAGGQ